MEISRRQYRRLKRRMVENERGRLTFKRPRLRPYRQAVLVGVPEKYYARDMRPYVFWRGRRLFAIGKVERVETPPVDFDALNRVFPEMSAAFAAANCGTVDR